MKSSDGVTRLAAAVLVGAFSASLGACGTADVRAGEVVVRDSAGVTIVENDRPVWRSGDGWTVAERPSLSIGMLDGPEEYQLDGVAGARRLSDGRIAVANAGTSQIRYYDADGRFLAHAGREGEGPGEFRSMGPFLDGRAGDSLAIYDFSARRISEFDAEGRFVRSLRGEDMTFPRGRFGDGRFLSATTRLFRPGGSPAGLSRDTIALLLSDLGAGVRDTVLRTVGDEMVTVTDGQSVSVSTRTFGMTTVTAVTEDRFFVGTQDAFEIAEYAQDGTLLRRIRRRWDPVPVTAAHIEENRRRQLEQAATHSNPMMREHFERMAANMDYPPAHASHGPIHLDRDGNLWVQERRGLSPDEPVYWSVFDAAGHLLGTVRTPTGVVVMDIGDDYVLGRWQDDLDVQYVHMYRLNK
jgi:hypothetical protein